MTDQQWQWVASDEALRVAIDEASREPAVAVDTEFRRRDTFFPQVALVQIATPSICWLIDPLTINDTSPLKQLLANPDIVKVLHSASEDLEIFEYWLGVLPQPLFDTQKAAGLLRLGFGLSYRALVEQLLDLVLDKEETQSDWLARPLTPSQQAYAAQDVIYLIKLYALLNDSAQSQGRVDWILEEGRFAETGGRGPLAKFKSAWKLGAKQQWALAALVAWREEQARTRDKPRSWILNDKVVSEMARRMPSNSYELGAVEGLPKGLIRRAGDALVNLINNAPESAQAAAETSFLKPPSSRLRRIAKSLGEVAEGLAAQLNVNVEMTVPNRELELIAREASGEIIQRPRAWSGWRATAVIEPLLEQAKLAIEDDDETC